MIITPMRVPLWSPTMLRLLIMHTCIHGNLIRFGGLISGFRGSLSWQILMSGSMVMGTMYLLPIIFTIPQQAGYPALTLQTDFVAGLYLPVQPRRLGLGQAENSGAMG